MVRSATFDDLKRIRDIQVAFCITNADAIDHLSAEIVAVGEVVLSVVTHQAPSISRLSLCRQTSASARMRPLMRRCGWSEAGGLWLARNERSCNGCVHCR